MKTRPVASSWLSLQGIVRHMADTERNWFGRILSGQPEIPPLFSAPSTPPAGPAPSDIAHWALDDAVWADDLATWQAQCAASRNVAAAHELDDAGEFRGKSIVLRSVYLQMIQEYARHNGHADLVRELIDGTTGV